MFACLARARLCQLKARIASECCYGGLRSRACGPPPAAALRQHEHELRGVCLPRARASVSACRHALRQSAATAVCAKLRRIPSARARAPRCLPASRARVCVSLQARIASECCYGGLRLRACGPQPAASPAARARAPRCLPASRARVCVSLHARSASECCHGRSAPELDACPLWWSSRMVGQIKYTLWPTLAA